MYIDVRELAASVSRGTPLDPPCPQAHYHSNSSSNHDMARLFHEETSLLTSHFQECQESLNQKWIIRQSSLGGRGLFAAQPIKKGTLIFTNKPLVVGVRADRAGADYCTVCFQIINSCHPCSRCNLIICSEECNTRQEHITECDFVTANWKIKGVCESHPETLARVQIYLKFLLLCKEQKELLSIFQRCASDDSNTTEIKQLCSEYILPEKDIHFIKLVHSIIKVNSFRIARNLQNSAVPLRGLYPLSAFLNHSCVPNTRNVFMKDYTMAVIATRDIAIGEEILTCYTGLLWCTPARRCQLYKTKNFWCQCFRCKDRTEMGTNLSALKCFNKECVGVLLPSSPLKTQDEWFCDNCGSKESISKICTVQSVLGSLVGTLDLDNEFRLDTSILGRLAEFIPYCSHIFVDLRLRLALRVGFTQGFKLNELSESRLALKESLCRGTLRTLAALGVGDAHLRGLLLYHLHAALAERARRSPDLYEELKSEIESTIEQAYNILQGDISAPPDLELRRRYLGPGCDKPQEERFFILDT